MSAAWPDRIAALWLSELTGLIRYAQHELRNEAQGVAVNLEVVRVRAEAAAISSELLQPYAANATRKFDDLSTRIEALLSFLRESTSSSDAEAVVTVLSKIVTGKRGDGIVVLEESESADCAIPSVALQLLVTHVALRALKSGNAVRAVTRGRPLPAISFHFARSNPDPIGGEVLEAAQSLGVHVQCSDSGVVMTFPTMTRSDTVIV